MTVEERLASIEVTLRAHTLNDTEQFNEIKRMLTEIDANVDALRLAEASRLGAAEAVAGSSKRLGGLVGGGIAAFIVASVEAIKYFFII